MKTGKIVCSCPLCKEVSPDDIYQKKNFPDALSVPQEWHLPAGRPVIFSAAGLQNPSRRRSMSAANFKKAEDFSPEVVAPQYIRILEELLGSGKRN
jgi:hypothetical protein